MSLPYAAGALYSTVEDLFRWDQVNTVEQRLVRDHALIVVLSNMWLAKDRTQDARTEAPRHRELSL